MLANDVTNQGHVVVGNTTAVGDYCVRVYDAAGTMLGPQTYRDRGRPLLSPRPDLM